MGNIFLKLLTCLDASQSYISMGKMSTRNLKGIGIFLALWIYWPLFSQPPAPISRVTVDSGRQHQRIDGFGINFNGTYFREAQEPMIDMLIDDLGATISRLDPYGISN